jgi:hypothetical protein
VETAVIISSKRLQDTKWPFINMSLKLYRTDD